MICGVNELSLVNRAYIWQNNSKANIRTNASTNLIQFEMLFGPEVSIPSFCNNFLENWESSANEGNKGFAISPEGFRRSYIRNTENKTRFIK